MSGILIGKNKKNLVFEGYKTKLPNRNIFMVAGPGSGKTTGFIIPNILFNTTDSILVTDTKGEVYELTSEIKRKQGYEVYVANFDEMKCSSRWNPLDYVYSEKDVASLAYKIVANKNDPDKKDIWFLSQQSLLQALILYFMHEKPKEERNFENILSFIQETDTTEDEDTGLADIDLIFLGLDAKHPARKQYEQGFSKSRSKTRMSIITSLVATLNDFTSDDVAWFMSKSDFLFSEAAEKKVIIYVIIPALDKTWENLINLYISQFCEELYRVGKMNHARLPQSVMIMCDEFTNCGKFDIIENFAATCRGYRISLCIVIQNITQIYDKYGKDKAESLIGNCSIRICMGNVNYTTAKYFSDNMGSSTVKVDTGGTSHSEGSKPSSNVSTSYNYIGKSLMSPDDIMNNLKPDEEICIFSNCRPAILKKAYYYELVGDFLKKYQCSQMDYNKEKGM